MPNNLINGADNVHEQITTRNQQTLEMLAADHKRTDKKSGLELSQDTFSCLTAEKFLLPNFPAPTHQQRMLANEQYKQAFYYLALHYKALLKKHFDKYMDGVTTTMGGDGARGLELFGSNNNVDVLVRNIFFSPDQYVTFALLKTELDKYCAVRDSLGSAGCVVKDFGDKHYYGAAGPGRTDLAKIRDRINHYFNEEQTHAKTTTADAKTIAIASAAVAVASTATAAASSAVTPATAPQSPPSSTILEGKPLTDEDDKDKKTDKTPTKVERSNATVVIAKVGMSAYVPTFATMSAWKDAIVNTCCSNRPKKTAGGEQCIVETQPTAGLAASTTTATMSATPASAASKVALN